MGQLELGQAPGNLVMNLAKLMQPKELTLHVGGIHQEHVPVFGMDDPMRVGLHVCYRVQEVDEALLGQEIRGELLNAVRR